MARIKQIVFTDYRAFYGINTLDLEGKHLLLYGENGSGKTSLYRGLQQFFEWVGVQNPPPLEANVFAASGQPAIALHLDDGAVFYTDSMSFNDYLQENAKQKPFFSYKHLLRVHLQADEGAPEINLLPLLLRQVLHNHENPARSGTALGDYRIVDRGASADFSKWNKDYCSGFEQVLAETKQCLNDYLEKYFGQAHLEVSFEWGTPLAFDANDDEPRGELFLRAKQSGYAINGAVGRFLNEARLSSIALSLYLAALRSAPTPSDSGLLFLDDIFLGIDTGNRIPLLRLIEEEFSKDYQVLMTTYDREWFELSRKVVRDSNHWTFAELYVGEAEAPGSREVFECALIQAPAKDYLARARQYADRKKGPGGSNIDYPAAANYLRKAAEEALKGLLHGKYRCSNEGIPLSTLDELWKSFIKQLDFCHGNAELKKRLDLIYNEVVKSVLNPFSHDTLAVLHRIELDAAFQFVQNLGCLKTERWINKGDMFYFDVSNDKNDCHRFIVEAKEDIYLCVFWEEGETEESPWAWDFISISPFNCKTRRVLKSSGEKEEQPVKQASSNLEKIFSQGHHFINRKETSLDWRAEIKADAIDKSINDLYNDRLDAIKKAWISSHALMLDTGGYHFEPQEELSSIINFQFLDNDGDHKEQLSVDLTKVGDLGTLLPEVLDAVKELKMLGKNQDGEGDLQKKKVSALLKTILDKFPDKQESDSARELLKDRLRSLNLSQEDIDGLLSA